MAQQIIDALTPAESGGQTERERWNRAGSNFDNLFQYIGNGNPAQWGALLDGVTDDTAAAQACLNDAGRLVIPAGKSLRIESPLIVPAGLSRLVITGGVGARILWRGDTTAQNLLVFTTNYSATTMLPHVEIRDIEVTGTHDVNRSFISSYPIFVQFAKRLVIDNVVVKYSRVMGIVARSCDYASVTNCTVSHCARDGINLGLCEEALIADNVVHDCDDDAIAVSHQIYTWQRGHTITGNKISKAQGIRCHGVNVATITGNVIQFFFAHGINVSNMEWDATRFEGLSPTFAVTITGNTLSDAMDRKHMDGLNQNCDYIRLAFDSAQAGSLTYVPGWRGTSPYAYYDNIGVAAESLSTTPIPASGSIVVANNTMMRTLPRTGLFSSYGKGKFWLRGGEYDYDLSLAVAIGFFKLSGYIDNLIIEGNTCQGEKHFLQVVASKGAVRPIRNAKVKDNVVSDITDACISSVATTETLDINFSGNTFDLDPYHSSANRAANGSWLAETVPAMLLSQGALGLSFRDNDLKNMARFAFNSLQNLIETGAVSFEGNRFWGDPAATGFSTSNKGIGQIPANVAAQLVHIECDPASADYGKVYRQAGRTAASIPTTGKFIAGEFVGKVNPGVAGAGGSQYVVRGWLRLTTGSGHVAGTDWAEARTLTGA